MFQAEQDADEADSLYLLIQRQFEDQDDNSCYSETHDEQNCDHFLLRRLDFTPQKLSIELDRPRNSLVSVTLAMTAAEFAEASQVVKIICGEIEPLLMRAVLIQCPNRADSSCWPNGRNGADTGPSRDSPCKPAVRAEQDSSQRYGALRCPQAMR
jgi:hypothetical protein